jgi:hypothetical protein
VALPAVLEQRRQAAWGAPSAAITDDGAIPALAGQASFFTWVVRGFSSGVHGSHVRPKAVQQRQWTLVRPFPAE